MQCSGYIIRLGTDGIHGCCERGCMNINSYQKYNIHVPLCCRDVISSKNVKERIFVVQLELKFLSRPVLLLSQEKPQQRLALQSCNILEGKTGQSAQNGSELSIFCIHPSLSTSLAAYVYSTLFLMTNQSRFQCFLLPFDLCK